MLSKDKGNIAELVVAAAIAKRGLTVLHPFGNNSRYDLVVDYKGVFIRLQVKTGRWVNNLTSILFETKTVSNGKVKLYTSAEIDAFAVYCPQLNVTPSQLSTTDNPIFIVPIERVSKGQCLLRVTTPTRKSDAVRITRYAKDFSIDRIDIEQLFGELAERLLQRPAKS